MHLFWCAHGRRHLPDLHLQVLSQSCFWTGKIDSNSPGMQVNGGGKLLILQAVSKGDKDEVGDELSELQCVGICPLVPVGRGFK